MISEWVVITGIAGIVFFLLSVFGAEPYRRSLRQWAACSALLCGAFLVGPPIDRAAGAVAIFLLCVWLFRMFISGRIYDWP